MRIGKIRFRNILGRGRYGLRTSSYRRGNVKLHRPLGLRLARLLGADPCVMICRVRLLLCWDCELRPVRRDILRRVVSQRHERIVRGTAPASRPRTNPGETFRLQNR